MPARFPFALLPLCLLAMAGCQTLPETEEMTATACEELPCREASRMVLLDGAGIARFLEVPQGPRWSAGLLSLIPGESAHLRWTETTDGELAPEWEEEVERADLSIRLEQDTASPDRPMRLRIQNRTEQAVYLEADHHPAGDDRFHPLFAATVPPGSRVERSWSHLILEIQLQGWRLLEDAKAKPSVNEQDEGKGTP